jgi:hypothetical protein
MTDEDYALLERYDDVYREISSLVSSCPQMVREALRGIKDLADGLSELAIFNALTEREKGFYVKCLCTSKRIEELAAEEVGRSLTEIKALEAQLAITA